MKRHRLISIVLCVVWPISLFAADDLAGLQERLHAQQARLRDQRHRLQTLKTELAEQEKQLRAAPISRTANPTASQPIQSASKPPASASQKRPGIYIPVSPGQEIQTASEYAPAFRLGPAAVRIQGYVGLGGFARSPSLGGGPGTSFSGVPAENTPAGNASEFRLTTQTSRLGIRIDVPFKQDGLTSYVEADFSGATPGNALLSSSSYGFRVRHAWVDLRHGKWEVAAGQMFSLLTPSRADIGTFPADVVTTQAVDTNYVAGLIWDRTPSIRGVYRPTKAVSFAVSMENPEQQTGSVVKFPSNLAPILSNQYNTGKGELKTPNIAPDVIFKGAFNTKLGNRNLHIDTGTVLRFFRSYNPTSLTEHQTGLGIGGNLNLTFDLSKKLRLLAQGFASSGGGRYIGGLIPDVVVRPDGSISPIKAYSWVTGLEWAATRRYSFFGYYSGLYGARNTAIDVDGSLIGFGYNGSSSARRTVREWTGGWAQSIWSGEDAGSIQFSAQYSFLENRSWWVSKAPSNTNGHMVFGQLRYNLP